MRILDMDQNNFYLMQPDPRFAPNIQNQNTILRQEINRLNGVAMTLDEKYQRSLKQMSNIIQANKNLKSELDNLKASFKDQIQNSLRDVRSNYEKKIEQAIMEKNDIYVKNQNLLREKQQLQRDYQSVEKSVWDNEALRSEINTLKKQNEKLLVQNLSLNQNQQNPEQKGNEKKLTQKIEQLSSKIAELNVQNTQIKKYTDSLQSEKQSLSKEIDSLTKKNAQLNSQLDKAQSEVAKQQNIEAQNRALQVRRYQMQSMDLRKQIAELTNQIERYKLEKMQMTTEINKNQAEIHLLTTLKSLHSQLQPMRYEIQQLKRDKYFDRQNTTKEKAEIQMKLLSSEHELETLKQFIKDLEAKNKELNQQIREKQWQKYRFQELEEQKRILEGRVIVYEAMEMVSRNRDKPHHVQRLEQFERRIQILLQQQNLQYLVNNANVHQLIAMKAYVIQLDNKLQTMIQQNQHFHKRYSQYKQKYQQLTYENKQIMSKHYSMINAYKGKIAGYEKLVMKLTEELQRYIKDNQGASIQSHYKSVITLYESKILSIYNQLNVKKQETRDQLKKIENLQLEYKSKVTLFKQLENQVSNLKTQNKELNYKLTARNLEDEVRPSLSSIPEDHYKSIISQKTKQILQLEEGMSKLKFKLDKMEFDHDRDLEDYKHKIARLEMEIQHYRLQQESAHKQLSTAKHSEQFGQLVSKLSNLERNVAAMSKSQINLHVQKDSTLDLQRQIQALKHEKSDLVSQLQSLRAELKRRFSTQSNQFAMKQQNSEEQINRVKDLANKRILELQNRIHQLEAQLKIRMKESEIKIKEIERDSIDKSSISIQISPQKANELQEQNIQLRNQLQRIRVSYRSMTIESEGLMVKIRDAEAYITGLKGEFDKVCNKMNEYEKQLNTRDEQLKQSKLKFNNLQNILQTQKASAKSSGILVNSKQMDERERKLKEREMELERSYRQIDSKFRDIERREIQSNRRQSEIEMKIKDFKDRLRKVEERERIVSEQQERLIRWSRELQLKEGSIRQMIERQQYNEFSAKQPTPTFPELDRSELQELQRKIKRFEIQLNQKLSIIQAKDEKLNKLIKQKAELSKDLQQKKSVIDEKSRGLEHAERQLSNLKLEVTRLQGQLEKLWKEYDLLKQQLRNKQRQLSDGALQREQVARKYEIEIRQLNIKIKQLENIRQSQSQSQSPPPSPSPPKNNINFAEMDREFETKLRQIQERNRQKIKQLYQQNEENTKQLQQTILDLKMELNRYRNQSPNQNKSEIETHTATIQSLQSHIKSLEDEVRRKQQINKQLQQDLMYYREVLAQRQQELQKLYDSTYLSSSHHGDGDNTDKIRLQDQIISLQAMLQNHNNHDQCIKKEHVLRMEIQRLSGMLQSRASERESQKPQSPHSNYLDNSYLQQLQETNRNLETDLTLLKQRLIADFDKQRNIEDYLAVLVLSFAEIEALRQRIYELQQNFKEEHQRQINVFKQIDQLKDHTIDTDKILTLLKQLQHAHRAFHEQEERSKSTYIKRINTQVLVLPGSQAISINEQINKNKGHIDSITGQMPVIGSQNTNFEYKKVENQTQKPWDVERSIKYSLNEDSNNAIGFNPQPISTSLSTYQAQFPSLSLSNQLPSLNINQNFNPGFSFPQPIANTSATSLVSKNLMFSGTIPHYDGGSNFRENRMFGAYDGQAKMKIQFGSNSQLNPSQNISSLPPGSFSGIKPSNQSGIYPSPNRYFDSSPTKIEDASSRLQVLQPFQFYQPSEGSQSSVRFPSETHMEIGASMGAPNVSFRTSESNIGPYMMKNNDFMR